MSEPVQHCDVPFVSTVWTHAHSLTPLTTWSQPWHRSQGVRLRTSPFRTSKIPQMTRRGADYRVNKVPPSQDENPARRSRMNFQRNPSPSQPDTKVSASVGVPWLVYVSHVMLRRPRHPSFTVPRLPVGLLSARHSLLPGRSIPHVMYDLPILCFTVLLLTSSSIISVAHLVEA